MEAAIEAAKQSLYKTRTYIAAKKRADEAQAVITQMRKSGEMAGRLEASAEFTRSVQALKVMESDALSKNADIAAAGADLAKAYERDAEVERARQAEIAKQLRSAEAERERVANLPVNRAIREHQLIEGMSINDAREALGNPYHISKSGSVTMLSWKRGDVYWSGVFVNGVCQSYTAITF